MTKWSKSLWGSLFPLRIIEIYVILCVTPDQLRSSDTRVIGIYDHLVNHILNKYKSILLSSVFAMKMFLLISPITIHNPQQQ